jgi:hypothetical protein
MTAGTVFLSMALLTAFNVNRVRTAASVGVNKDASCVCIIKTFFDRRIYYFLQKARAGAGWSLESNQKLEARNLASINIASTNIAARFIVL